MIPIHTVVMSSRITYMLSNLVSKREGIKRAKIMIIPPMVGVPAFSFCPAKPKSRTDSPICRLYNILMMCFPLMVAISSDNIAAKPARKEMYWKAPAPGTL